MKKIFLLTAMAISFTLSASPDTIILDGQTLQNIRSEITSGSHKYDAALKDLTTETGKYLGKKITTVMDKKLTPPSGDKHDWLSWGIYWWPDHNQPDGKPYIHKDGQTNPQTSDLSTDGGTSKFMLRATLPLALAYWYTGEKKYAVKAVEIIRAWYLDPATAMNPNLNYGEGVPGRNDGRSTGIITFSMRLHNILDAVRILETSDVWTAEDSAGMKEWIDKYCTWLETSKLAEEARFSKNNHATWFAAQYALIKVYQGKNAEAKAILEEAARRMLPIQFDAAGKQPLELQRTRSLDYTTMNINGWLNMARLGQLTGFDLWNYRTDNGITLKEGAKFLLPYASGKEQWPYQQIANMNRQTLLETVQRIMVISGDASTLDDDARKTIEKSPAILKYR